MSHCVAASLSLADPARTNTLLCRGAWTLSGMDQKALSRTFMKLSRQYGNLGGIRRVRTSEAGLGIPTLVLDASAITDMDTSGAWQLAQWVCQISQQGGRVSLLGLSQKQDALFTSVQNASEQLRMIPTPKGYRGLAYLGKKTVDQFLEIGSFLYFVGKSFVDSFLTPIHYKRPRFGALMSIIESSGSSALGIIAVLSFMIGIVLTYQMGFQLKQYGANLFIIELLGLAILREFAPLVTAIMVAGRSGSAFTAQLGMMKINEEIDALSTMGILPNQLLVLPRILGLTIALPLLTVWADIFGMLGGMAMTQGMLHISYLEFLRRFPQVVHLSSLLIGLGKTPVFALIISSIACFQGLRVTGSAYSVGRQTTRSVVQAIFFIITADALFSILFSTLSI